MTAGRLTNGGELLSVDADHAQLVDLLATAQVKQAEANDADLFVGARGTGANPAGGVLAGTDL